MPLVQHNATTEFVSGNSNLPISTVVNDDLGSTQSGLWEQSLRPGEVIPTHYHNVEEIITILKGRVECTVDGESAIVDADANGRATVFLPIGSRHQIRNIGETDMTMLAFFSSPAPEIFSADE